MDGKGGAKARYPTTYLVFAMYSKAKMRPVRMGTPRINSNKKRFNFERPRSSISSSSSFRLFVFGFAPAADAGFLFRNVAGESAMIFTTFH
jgi:hypothetical protein